MAHKRSANLQVCTSATAHTQNVILHPPHYFEVVGIVKS